MKYPLSYQSIGPGDGEAGALGYWSAFGAAALAGLICTAVLDDLFTMAFRGHDTENLATYLSIGGIILAVPVLHVLRSLRRQPGTLAAAMFGFFSPLVVLAVFILIAIV